MDTNSLFSAFDRGVISRRQLLQALGIAVAIKPAAALAQGQCGGAKQGHARVRSDAGETSLRADRLEDRDARSLLLPVRRLSEGSRVLPGADELEDPQRRRQAGRCSISVTGAGSILRGGYVAPPPPPAMPRRDAPAGAAAGGQGRGGQGGGAPRAPRNAAFDGMALGHRQVGCEESRSGIEGARPLARRRQSRRLPELPRQGSRRLRSVDHATATASNRRRAPANGKTSAPAPFESTAWKTVWLDHISFEVTNYKETAAFYHALLGWKLGEDEGSQNTCRHRRHRQHHHPPRQSRRPAGAGRATRLDGTHLVRHREFRARCGEGRAHQARPERA